MAKGFTLIELLIVIVIISVIVSFAVLSIHINQNKKLETFSQQLTALLLLAQEEALLRSVTLKFSITKKSYQLDEYSQKNASWQALHTSALSQKSIPDDIQLTLKISDQTESHFIISPNGEISPFVLYIGKINVPARYKIVGESNGHIKNEPAHED